MSIFGWDEKIKKLESGKFWCPSCRRDGTFALIEARKWFKFFFVPIIPESRPIRAVQCDRCHVNFDESVLGIVVSAGLSQRDLADTTPGKWRPGARVLAVWPIEQIYWYPATVKKSTNRWVEVDYDDGHHARVKASEVMEIDIQVGSRVFARLRGGPAYLPGEVTEVRGDRIRVAYDDGASEMTTISVIRVVRGPGMNVEWQYGDRVLAPWDPPFYYPGTLTEVNNETARVEFDDGDQIEVPVAILRKLDIQEGDRVYCRWREGPNYFSGKVEEMASDEVFVKYDDGRTERTTIRLVRVIPDELSR